MSEEVQAAEVEKIKYFLFDENEDGTLDDIIDNKRNAFGQITEVSIDYNNDGKTDAKIYLEYDEKGRIVKKSTVKNLNGGINSVVIFEYDAEGKITVHYDDNADGKVDYIEKPDGTIEDVRDTEQKIRETAADIVNTVKKDFKGMVDKVLKKKP